MPDATDREGEMRRILGIVVLFVLLGSAVAQSQPVQSQPLTISGLLQQGYEVVGAAVAPVAPGSFNPAFFHVFLKKGNMLYFCQARIDLPAARTDTCGLIQ
jgi:hypothetical protein